MIFQAWCKKFHIGQNWEKYPQMHDPTVQRQNACQGSFSPKLSAGRSSKASKLQGYTGLLATAANPKSWYVDCISCSTEGE